MDTRDLFSSCKKGDIERVKYLVQNKEVELNVRDVWDSTPLYYACLCGHKEVVEYLLSRGAQCDSNTFDGERCVYGALTNDIRKLLLDHRMLTPVTMRREAYTEFLRRLLEDSTHKDLVFLVHGERVTAHSCILAARSHFLTKQLEGRWREKSVISLNKKEVSGPAFRCLLEWLYTGQVKVEIKNLDDLTRLARYCQLSQLEQELQDAFRKADSYVASKRGAEITSLYLSSTSSQWELQQDLGVLAQQALPLELRQWNAGTELPCMPCVEPRFVDLVFDVQGHKFLCHKSIFFARSEYFRALVQDHFSECITDTDYNLPLVYIHQVSPAVFANVILFTYTNSCNITEETVAELLNVADMFLLPGLKRECGNWLVRLVDTDTVLEILRTARLFHLPRLEDICTEYLAKNIDQLFDDLELHRLVESDAREVKGRQDTDSIQVVDDIRSHIRNSVRTMSEMQEAEERLNLVDLLLANLGLDA